MEYICALATPIGKSAIAIIRTSGNGIFSILKSIFIPAKNLNKPLQNFHKQFLLGHIVESNTNNVIDEVAFIPFIKPHSYTGEDVAEIHCHGNSIIIEKIIKELYKIGFIPASAGEFTKRAFLNKKINISQAEAIAQIINARNNIELQQAFSLKKGVFQQKVLLLKESLLDIVADITAELDFVDQDIQFCSKKEKLKKLKNTIQQLEDILENSNQIELYTKGFSVMFFGSPNVGKSSLINALLGYDRSIVSEEAGTTRDYIKETITINGHTFHIIDTAGIRSQTTNTIEQKGISNTFQQLTTIDIVLLLLDTSIPFKESIANCSLDSLLAQNKEKKLKIIAIGNKIDIMHPSWQIIKKRENNSFSKINSIPSTYSTLFQDMIFISAKYNQNIEPLKIKIIEYIQNEIPKVDGILLSSWQKEILNKLKNVLQSIYTKIYGNELIEIIVADFDYSISLFSSLLGEISNEDILTKIFSKFCIGK